MKKLLLLAPLAILLAGCGSIPQGADRINMITAEEAKANGCKLLDKAGSVSGILINGYKRNTQVAVRKALKVPGATHVGYTKGKPGASNVRMFIWSCPNPDLKTNDPKVAAWQKEYLGHDSTSRRPRPSSEGTARRFCRAIPSSGDAFWEKQS